MKKDIAIAYGTVEKAVYCEKCKCHYIYKMARRSASSAIPTMRGVGLVGGVIAGAVNAVADATVNTDLDGKAQRGLDRKLREEVEPVPCPDCGWYQEEMVEHVRRKLQRSTGMFTLLVSIIAALCILALLIAMRTSMYTRASISDAAIWLAAGCIVLIAALYGMLWMKHGKHDVNAGYPQKRPAYPGAPKAQRVKDIEAKKAQDALELDLIGDADAEEWFYWIDGQRIGPTDWLTLRQLAQDGEILPSARIEGPGMGKGAAAEMVPGLLD